MRYRLVPEEPSRRMIEARNASYLRGERMLGKTAAAEFMAAYSALLAASPVFEPSDACVETVARSICQADGFDPDAVSYNFERHARAAIEAFRKAVAEEPERAGGSGAG